MSKYLVFLQVLVVVLSSYLQKEPDYCIQSVIVNKTSKEVIISEYDNPGIEKEVFKITTPTLVRVFTNLFQSLVRVFTNLF